MSGFPEVFQQTRFAREYTLLEPIHVRDPEVDGLFHVQHHEHTNARKVVRFLRESVQPYHEGLPVSQIKTLLAAEFRHPSLLTPQAVDVVLVHDERYRDDEAHFVFVVMILDRAFSSLYDYVNQFHVTLTDGEKLRVALEILGGAWALHRYHWTHGAIHPNNIFLLENPSGRLNAVLGDWERLQYYNNDEKRCYYNLPPATTSSSLRGSHPFMCAFEAPEVVLRKTTELGSDVPPVRICENPAAVDVWSLASVLFYWFFGQPLITPTVSCWEQYVQLLGHPGDAYLHRFQIHVPQTSTAISRRGPLSIAEHMIEQAENYADAFETPHLYKEVCNVLSACLRWNPEERWSMEQLTQGFTKLSSSMSSLQDTWKTVSVPLKTMEFRHEVSSNDSDKSLLFKHQNDIRLINKTLLDPRLVKWSYRFIELIHSLETDSNVYDNIYTVFPTCFSLMYKAVGESSPFVLGSSKRRKNSIQHKSKRSRARYNEAQIQSAFLGLSDKYLLRYELEVLRRLQFRFPFAELLNTHKHK